MLFSDLLNTSLTSITTSPRGNLYIVPFVALPLSNSLFLTPQCWEKYEILYIRFCQCSNNEFPFHSEELLEGLCKPHLLQKTNSIVSAAAFLTSIWPSHLYTQ